MRLCKYYISFGCSVGDGDGDAVATDANRVS